MLAKLHAADSQKKIILQSNKQYMVATCKAANENAGFKKKMQMKSVSIVSVLCCNFSLSSNCATCKPCIMLLKCFATTNKQIKRLSSNKAKTAKLSAVQTIKEMNLHG